MVDGAKPSQPGCDPDKDRSLRLRKVHVVCENIEMVCIAWGNLATNSVTLPDASVPPFIIMTQLQ